MGGVCCALCVEQPRLVGGAVGEKVAVDATPMGAVGSVRVRRRPGHMPPEGRKRAAPPP